MSLFEWFKLHRPKQQDSTPPTAPTALPEGSTAPATPTPATQTDITQTAATQTATVKKPLTPAAKKAQKQALFRALNNCKETLREPFLRANEMQLLYRNGEAFALLHSEGLLLQTLPTLLPQLSMQQLTRIENLALALELIQEKKAALDATLAPFLAQETKLKADIEAFTKVVKEAQTKYKLSPDWNGKKPALMSLGSQLETRRAAYDKADETLSQQIEKLYALHAEFADEFKALCEEMIPLLEATFAALA